MTDGVRTVKDGAVLEITLDRPKANAIDLAASRRLNQVVTSFFQGVLVDGADATALISRNFVFHNCCGIYQGTSGGTPYSLGDNYVRDNLSADVFNVSPDSPL